MTATVARALARLAMERGGGFAWWRKRNRAWRFERWGEA